MRLHQLTGINPAEIVVPFNNAGVSSLWAENEQWQWVYSIFLNTSSRYPKSFIKRPNWIFPHIVNGEPNSEVTVFYTVANKSRNAGYK